MDGHWALERFVGVRGMLQAAVELAIDLERELYGLLEGAPFQKERQLFTDKFNWLFLIHDTPIYGRLGLTAKFLVDRRRARVRSGPFQSFFRRPPTSPRKSFRDRSDPAPQQFWRLDLSIAKKGRVFQTSQLADPSLTGLVQRG